MAGNPVPQPMTGRELRELRQGLGVSQKVFAPLIGTTERALRQLEWRNGRVSPKRAAAAQALQADPALPTLPKKYDGNRGPRERNLEIGPVIEAALEGKTIEAIALELRIGQGPVRTTLRYLGFPQRDSPCRFFHGEPVTKKHFDDFCSDFGVSRQTAVQAGYAEGLIQVQEWKGKNQPKGKSQQRSLYTKAITHLSRLDSNDVLNLRLADLVLGLRRTWTKRFCLVIPEYAARGPLRRFLQSEMDIATQKQRLYKSLKPLRAWLRTKETVEVREILNWIAHQREQEIYRKNGDTFAGLLFRWPLLKKTIQAQGHAIFGQSSSAFERLVHKLLAEEYGSCTEKAICRAAKGPIEPLQPVTLGMAIREHYRAAAELKQAKNGKPAGSRGRQHGGFNRRTKERIRFAAHCKVLSLNDYRTALRLEHLYPKASDPMDSAKNFVREHREAIVKEATVVSAMPLGARQVELRALIERLKIPDGGQLVHRI